MNFLSSLLARLRPPKPATAVSPSTFSTWKAHGAAIFPPGDMLTAAEIAKALGMNPRTVARLFELGEHGDKTRPWLMGLEFNAGRKGERLSRRIPRDNAILLWACSANYTPADVLALLFDVLEKRTDAELLAITQRANELIRRRASG